MLVKSLTDDLAWEVQRKLVRTYFRAKQDARATAVINLDEVARQVMGGIMNSAVAKAAAELKEEQAKALANLEAQQMAAFEQRLIEVAAPIQRTLRATAMPTDPGVRWPGQ